MVRYRTILVRSRSILYRTIKEAVMLGSALFMTLLPALAAVAESNPSPARETRMPRARLSPWSAMRSSAAPGATSIRSSTSPTRMSSTSILPRTAHRRSGRAEGVLSQGLEAARGGTRYRADQSQGANDGRCGGADLQLQEHRRRTGRVQRWNCTEVFRRTAQGWRIIQTHWSWTKPQLAAAQ